MGLVTTGELNDKILNIHTGYLGKIKTIKGNTATVQPLTIYKAVNGKAKTQSLVSAVIPNNIKYKEKKITYFVSQYSTETTTVLVPDKLAVGDIVYVGICDRDITHAKNGKINEATNRHHDINDGVILKFVR